VRCTGHGITHYSGQKRKLQIKPNKLFFVLLYAKIESKIGRLEYSIGKYERLIRVTVPIRFFSRDRREEEANFIIFCFHLI
jgi:hypothetical protein